MKQTFEDCFGVDTTPKVITGLDNFGMPDIITKYAAIQIANPTQSNVEDFIRAYAENEISGINGVKVQKMEIMPNSYDGENLVSATGSVTLKVDGANGKIILPFSVEDSELNPFDVIQVGDERVPFTRINLAKVVTGIVKQEKDPMFGSPQGIKKYVPYLGVSKEINTPASSEGFLGTTLHIQDKYSTRNNNASTAMNHYVTAEELLTLTEKVAHLKETQPVLTKIAAEIPMEEIDKKQEETLSKIAAIKWNDISECKTGDYIAIPVISSAPGLTDESTVIKALVVDTKEGKAVITQDCKMALFNRGEKMACIKENKQTFKLPTVRLSQIERDDTFLAFRGNDILGPFLTKYDNERCPSADNPDYSWTDKGAVHETKHYEDRKYLRCIEATYVDKIFQIAHPSERREKIFIMSLTGHKFVEMTAKEYAETAAKVYHYTESEVIPMLPYELQPDRPKAYPVGEREPKVTLIATDEDTPVVAIKGPFIGYLKTPEELQYFGIDKTASDAGTCEIYRRGDNFNVKISYSDKSHKILPKRIKEFKDIEDYRVKGVLKSLGFDPGEAGEIVWKVKNSGQAIVALPDKDSAKDITGASESSALKNKVMGAGIKDIAKDLGAQFTYALADVVKDPNTPDILSMASSEDLEPEKLAAYLNRRANTAREIAGEFEKIAVERQSESMKEIAAYMVLGSEIFKKAASLKEYDDFDEVSGHIFSIKDDMEKRAYDLTSLAFQERRNDNFIIHPAFCKEAVIILDEMLKVAESCGKRK